MWTSLDSCLAAKLCCTSLCIIGVQKKNRPEETTKIFPLGCFKTAFFPERKNPYDFWNPRRAFKPTAPLCQGTSDTLACARKALFLLRLHGCSESPAQLIQHPYFLTEYDKLTEGNGLHVDDHLTVCIATVPHSHSFTMVMKPLNDKPTHHLVREILSTWTPAKNTKHAHCVEFETKDMAECTQCIPKTKYDLHPYIHIFIIYTYKQIQIVINHIKNMFTHHSSYLTISDLSL